MTEILAERTRYYTPYTAKKKEDYITSHIQNRIAFTLSQKSSSSDYVPWDADEWEDFLFDDLAYFSEAFDHCHKHRKHYKRNHQELWPNFIPVDKI